MYSLHLISLPNKNNKNCVNKIIFRNVTNNVTMVHNKKFKIAVNTTFVVFNDLSSFPILKYPS